MTAEYLWRRLVTPSRYPFQTHRHRKEIGKKRDCERAVPMGSERTSGSGGGRRTGTGCRRRQRTGNSEADPGSSLTPTKTRMGIYRYGYPENPRTLGLA